MLCKGVINKMLITISTIVFAMAALVGIFVNPSAKKKIGRTLVNKNDGIPKEYSFIISAILWVSLNVHFPCKKVIFTKGSLKKYKNIENGMKMATVTFIAVFLRDTLF